MEKDNKNPACSPEPVCPGKLVELKTAKDKFLDAREKLASAEGPEYWRSLEELAGSEEFKRALNREFPNGASEWLDPVSRRGFLKLMGASMALAGLTSCVKQPTEPIVPYVRQPEELVPGKPMLYATAMTLGGYAYPQLVVSHEGRPTKIEGNPEHPACLGGSDVFSQAAVLELYDPDRAPTHLYQGEVQPWLAFVGAVRGQLAGQRAVGGAGLRFLTQTISSPSLAAQMRGILQAFPQAKWYQWEPTNRDNAHAGAKMTFGEYVETRYNIAEADVILSLDADIFAGYYPGTHRYAREWASRRVPDAKLQPHADGLGRPLPIRPMNRLYSIESSPTLTGAKSDHGLPVKPSDVEQLARLIATRLGINAGGGAPRNEYEKKFVDGLVKDLQGHRGTSLVIPGDYQPPVVHALAHAMNELLGNVGRTVVYTDPVEANPTDQAAGMRELVADMNAGKVDLLVIVGGNPAYDAPADLDFAGALKKVASGAIYHGLYVNETADQCAWFINATHYLEAWGDARAYDGSVCIAQPLIAPLYGGVSRQELLAAFTDNPQQSGYDTVRAYWRSQHPGADFEQWWRKAVHDGFIANTVLPPKAVKVASLAFPSGPPAAQGIEISLRPDPSVYDGRFSNNAWLQELPKPFSKVTWDNPVFVGPAMAKRMDLKYGDVIEIASPEGRKVKGAVWVQAGQPDNAMTVFLGYGRTRAGRAGNGAGFDAYPLRSTAMPWTIAGAQVRKTGEFYQLTSRQGTQDMENRHLVREATLTDYQQDPMFAHRHEEDPPRQDTLYPNYDYTAYAWGMTIDQNACVGCNACVVACQAENNVPVVGKREVARGRHMHWLRVDSYYQGDPENPRVYFQPVPCMHCENAPCELVCPVAATVHSTEGLNDMVYNRCVGTRYCSNNCPYKVRRFNFLLFQDWNTPQYKMMRNPDVSVRSRGVMEKCTYCVQRLSKARITAQEEERLVRDVEVQPACQQACPADAIVFGNINDKNSRVTRLKEEPLNYGLLTDLNTRPRTTYLAMVRNPNPEIPEEKALAAVGFRSSAGGPAAVSGEQVDKSSG